MYILHSMSEGLDMPTSSYPTADNITQGLAKFLYGGFLNVFDSQTSNLHDFFYHNTTVLSNEFNTQ